MKLIINLEQLKYYYLGYMYNYFFIFVSTTKVFVGLIKMFNLSLMMAIISMVSKKFQTNGYLKINLFIYLFSFV